MVWGLASVSVYFNRLFSLLESGGFCIAVVSGLKITHHVKQLFFCLSIYGCRSRPVLLKDGGALSLPLLLLAKLCFRSSLTKHCSKKC